MMSCLSSLRITARKDSVPLLITCVLFLKIPVNNSFGFCFLKNKCKDGNTIASLNENDRTLGYYSPQDYYCIHVNMMNNCQNNLFTRLSIWILTLLLKLENWRMFPKLKNTKCLKKTMINCPVLFENKRFLICLDSVRKFKERLAQTHPEFASKPKEAKDEAYLAGEASGFEVNNRSERVLILL